MANIIINSADEILFRALESLSGETQLNRVSNGSKIRAIMSVISKELESAQGIMQANVAMSVVGGASGPYLDMIGGTLGVYRASAATAGSMSAGSGLRLTAPEGMTFGQINSGSGISVPAGTIVSDSGGRKYYRTVRPVLLEPNMSEQYVEIIGVEAGADSNIAAGELTSINFSSYTAYPDYKLTVSNTSSIGGGDSSESDMLYRHRIQNSVLSNQTGNLTAVRLAVLSIPGVRNVTVYDMHRGVGTASVMVETDSDSMSSTLWDTIRSTIDSTKAAGINIMITEPQNVGLDLTLSIEARSPESLINIASSIRSSVSNFVREAPIGVDVSVNQLASVIQTSHPDIRSMGSPGRPLDIVSIWRTSAYSSARVPFRLSATSNIPLRSNERLVLEGGPAEAVKIVSI